MSSTTTIERVSFASASESDAVLICNEVVAAQPAVLAPIPVNLPELTRWEIQARILSDQPTADIAAAMGLPLSMVTAFESSEFDVRSSLQHSSVVLHTIIGIPLTEEWPASDVKKFWMWVGFAYGVPAIELTIPPFKSLSPKLQSLGLLAYLHSKCNACEELRLLVAGKVTPIPATITAPGRKLVGRLNRVSQRRVRPVDLLTSLTGLLCRPPAHEAVRDEEPQPAPFYLKESA